MAEPLAGFAGLLRRLRVEAGLTQEELAEAAGLSQRAIGDLERGVVASPRRETVRLLAEALRLGGPVRGQLETAARGRAATARAGPGSGMAMRTLPGDIASFTGREHELRELVDAAGGAVSVHVVGGMAGIGKTAFAVHAAHRLADRFPGGQIFLPLHGHTPGRQPAGPADALASLLMLAGIPAAAIPPDLESRTALWRDWLAGRRLLLVLDDAVSSEQVRPLLPGAGGSLVVVTSRRRLSALEDAQTITLDTLPPEEAAGLLVRLAMRTGLDSADPAAAEIARLCGYLPLAIGMAARQLHHHPAWTPSGRAAELAGAVDRLELLATENISVAAAFDLSYADLARDQQRLFRRLGLHPGSEIDAYAAAAVDGIDVVAARHRLDILYDQYLLTEPAPGRYRMHDLIREHARALGDRDPDSDRQQGLERLLEYYQHAAARADALVARQARRAPAPPAGTLVPVLVGRDQALEWARAERAALLACLAHATRTGQHARVIALTAGLAGLLRHDGPWTEAITLHVAAVQAAEHTGDRPGQASALTNLGDVRRLTGDHAGAIRDLDAALSIYRDLGDRVGQANALASLGIARRVTGDLVNATWHLEEALGIYRDLGDRPGQSNALTFLGTVRMALGEYPAAARDLEEALGIARDSGDRYGQASALTFLGSVRRATGDYPAAVGDLEEALAIARDLDARLSEIQALNEAGLLHTARADLGQARSCYEQALSLSRQTGNSRGEAHALAGLGRCALAIGRAAEGEAGLRQALEIFQRIGAAEAAGLSTELGVPSGPAAEQQFP